MAWDRFLGARAVRGTEGVGDEEDAAVAAAEECGGGIGCTTLEALGGEYAGNSSLPGGVTGGSDMMTGKLEKE